MPKTAIVPKDKRSTIVRNFELLFNEISDAMFLHDFRGNILMVNNYACQRLGYSKQEFATMNVNDFAPDDILDNWETRIETIKKQGQFTFETAYVTKDHQHLEVEIVSKIISIEGKELVLSSGRDITERKNYENKLVELKKKAEENELELKAIFDKAPATIILFDENSRLLRINKKGIKKFRIEGKNWMNQRIGDVINCVSIEKGSVSCGFSESCFNCGLSEVLRNTISLNKEYHKKEVTIEFVQDGMRIKKTMLVSTSMLKKNDQSNYLATIDDITSRKQMELDLIAAKEKAEESEKLKTAFLNNISHEIRTPLNGLLGFIHLIDDDSYNFSKEEKKGFIEIIQKSGDRLLNTVNDLVEVAKLNSGIETVTPDEINLFGDLQTFLTEQKGRFINPNVSFEFTIDQSLRSLMVILDKVKLHQVLVNLIDNAFKFTSSGTISLSVTRQSNELIFTIEDTGIGIDVKNKECIFKPFRQAETGLNKSFEGTGLGLTIAQKLVDIMGGKIWFESEIGKGTVFHFSLPLQVAASENLPELNDYTEILAGRKILIAEDDVSNFLFFDAVLSNRGCKVVHALNGKSAVEIFAHDPTFDIIIMDIKMPVMDGLEATYKIKAIRNDIPIVAYSAYVLNEEKQKALEAGCIDFLAKPAGKEQLLKVIEKHIPALGGPQST